MPKSKATKPDWQMSGITAGPVEDYLYSMLPPRDEVLTKMEEEAAKRKIPIVGPAVGRILHQLALMIGAKTVFEMGQRLDTRPSGGHAPWAKVDLCSTPTETARMPMKRADISRKQASHQEST